MEKYPQEFVYGVILKIFERVTNRGYEGASQYAAIQLTHYLVFRGFIPTGSQLAELLEKIKAYILQTQINFQAFAHSFGIFSRFAAI